MTNFKIIMNSAIQNGIFTQQQIENFLSKNTHPPIFTYQEWQKQGFQVKKGEKAKMTCEIWMPKKQTQEEIENNEEKEFFVKKAYFFTQEQVEKMKKSI